jgi:anti-anti-sigma factor
MGNVLALHSSDDSVCVVRVQGELDGFVSPQIVDAIDDCVRHGAKGVVLDMRTVTFCDAASVRAVLTASRHATLGGASFRALPSTVVRKLAAVLCVDNELEGDRCPPALVVLTFDDIHDRWAGAMARAYELTARADRLTTRAAVLRDRAM